MFRQLISKVFVPNLEKVRPHAVVLNQYLSHAASLV